MFVAFVVGFTTWVSLAELADANVFLGRSPSKVAMAPLLEELERIVGKVQRSSTESKAARIEEALRPTFQAMPKMPDGGVKPDGVRYMVHRYFVDRHGWFVDGLGSGSDPTNSSSPAAIFKDQGSDDIQDFFDARFEKHTFSLHHVAVFAAALESYVHGETLERLGAAYRSLGLSEKSSIATEQEVDAAIEGYMVMYVLGSNYSEVTSESLAELRAQIIDYYPTWGETKKWIAEVHREVIQARTADAPSPMSFDFAVQVLEEIGDRYGRWQNSECLDLKNSLLKLEEGNTGRVRLEAFYGSALQGSWQFSESIGYLRQLGALDESDPQRPSVIIPNYINSPSNCVASSKFYSVCCIDECESLISHIETHIAAPEAAPQRIVEIVSALSSATVEAPRVLSSSLLQRLDEIASHHHGTVPLHGRLFVQWMHHAFPRECTYPHLSGTTNPLTPLEWEKQTGETSVADEDSMNWHISTAQSAPVAEQESDELPWLEEEELFVKSQTILHQEGASSTVSGVLRSIVGFVAIVSLMLGISKMPMKAKGAFHASSQTKYYV